MSTGARRARASKGSTVARGGRNVVREVSLEIPPGEVTALLGPNGAGKSSMVLAVGGVLQAGQPARCCSTSATCAGSRPERIRAAGVAIVPEGRRLLPELTVSENLRVATYTLSGADAEAGRERALELFPELEKRLELPGAARSPAASSRWSCSPRRSCRIRGIVIIDELSLGLAPVVVNRLIPTIRVGRRVGASACC